MNLTKTLKKGDKVKVSGANLCGEVIETYETREVSDVIGKYPVLMVKVQHDNYTMDYWVSELRKVN